MTTFTVEGIRLTRVPYFDVVLDPEVIGFTAQQVIDVPWGLPEWASPDGGVRVGQAVWVVESGSQTVVVDPCGAADAFLRSGPEAATHEATVARAMASAGYPVDQVDFVFMSHLDGIGMVGSVDESGGWSPLFSIARIVISRPELAHIDAQPEVGGGSALRDLMEQGVIDRIECPREGVPGVVMGLTGGHSPGHAVLRIGDGAVFIGHLAINPVQVSGGIMPGVHADPSAAFTALEHELEWAAERGAFVIGPLWPGPGAGWVEGPPWSLVPAFLHLSDPRSRIERLSCHGGRNAGTTNDRSRASRHLRPQPSGSSFPRCRCHHGGRRFRGRHRRWSGAGGTRFRAFR